MLSFGKGDRVHLLGFHIIHVYGSLPFRLDLPSVKTIEPVLDKIVGALRNVDLSNLALLLHPGSGIDRVSPNVVLEFPGSDNPGNNGP